MLTTRDLRQLAKAFEDRQVLTVYLHPATSDPAARHQWRAEFEQAVRAVVTDPPPATHDEREALRRAIDHLRTFLMGPDAPLDTAGLLAVGEEDAIIYAVPLETPVPSTAVWQRGIFLAPLLHEVSAVEPVPLLLVDERSVRRGRLTLPRHLELLEHRAVHLTVDVERHLGSGSSGFHPGTRGGMAADALDRRQRAARDRMFAEALVPALAMLPPDGWLVIGGSPRAAAAARALVPDPLAARVVVVEGLAADAATHEIAEAIREALAARMAERDLELVRGLLETAAARGRATAGLTAARAMLARADVADLILSEHFVETHPADTDALLHHAFRQGARVREVHGTAADVMDASAEGVVARLRYAPPVPPA